MPSLVNQKVLLGVTGGIAAYKIPELVRLLKKEGADVKVIVTSTAVQFVTAETLSVLSGNPVYSDFFKNEQGEWTNHVELGLWADLFVIAPVTATSLSRMATGKAENLLTAVYLSARCPVMLAPAMDLDMLAHETTRRNLDQLKEDGCIIIEPGTGELASGLVGKGRMAEPSEILEAVKNFFKPKVLFAGKKVLITAGPTYEKLDPVRFIGNFSTGKMGYALAETFAQMGAEVHLVSGPTNLPVPENVNIHLVTGAEEMLKKCREYSDSDIIIMAAAVADYRPEATSGEKIKKTDEEITLRLVKNPDILSTMALSRQENQWIAGFALETNNELENAREKLKRKNLDMIVMNSLNDEGAGFGHDTNKVTLLFKDNSALELPLMSKKELAMKIAETIFEKTELKKN